MKIFDTIILDEADKFILKLDKKSTKKLFFVIRNAEQNTDPKFFKKLRNDIWEFKVKFSNNQIRVLAFWDKSDKSKTLVIATNDSIRKLKKHLQLKFKELKELEQNILNTNKLLR